MIRGAVKVLKNQGYQNWLERHQGNESEAFDQRESFSTDFSVFGFLVLNFLKEPKPKMEQF